MNWCDPDLSEAMSLFKQKMTLFIEDEEITEEAKQARKICRGIGDAGLRRLNASGLTEEQKKSPIHLWNFFENQLTVNVNFRIHRPPHAVPAENQRVPRRLSPEPGHSH